MIAFGACVGSPHRLGTLLRPSLQDICPGAALLTTPGGNSIHRAYNRLLDEASRLPDLDGLVLLHEDVVVRDHALRQKLEQTFLDPSVGLTGIVGARRPTSLRWHGRDECYGHVEDSRFRIKWRSPNADVDVVDGLFMALSPWTVQNLRFDAATYSGFHGYDAEMSLQVRSRGLRVVVRDIDVLHVSKGGYGRADEFVRADRAWRAKWAKSPFVGRRTRTWDTHRPLRNVMDRTAPVGAVLMERRIGGPRGVGRHSRQLPDQWVRDCQVEAELVWPART